MTGSLARDGQGGMTAELPLANAGFSYSSDPNTGMHRTGADAQAIECGGVDIVEVDASGATVNGNLEVTGAVTSGGAALLPIGLGPLPWSGTAAPAKWLLCRGQTLLRASYPGLWAFAASEIALGNTLFTNGNGTTTFTVPDLRGRVPAGADAGAGRLTDAVSGFGDGLGEAGGTQAVALSLTQLPTGITSSGVSTITVQTVQKVLNGPNQGSAQGGGSQVTASDPGSGGALSLLNSTGNNTIGVTSTNTSGAVHTNVQPTIITNYIIYAGA